MTFKVLLHHYGSFTSPPGRKFVDGIVATVDLVELNNFSTNQMKAILTKCLGYDENSSTFLYMKKPNRSLDSGLVLLDDAIQDIDSILTYIQTYQNLLHVYVSRVELSPLVMADQLEDGVTGKIQIYVSHHPIDLSTELIPNDGSLEEAYAGIISEETKIKQQESLSGQLVIDATKTPVYVNGGKMNIIVPRIKLKEMKQYLLNIIAQGKLEIYIDHVGVNFVIAKYICPNATLAEMINHVITDYTSDNEDERNEVTQTDYTYDHMVEWAEHEHFEYEENKQV
ncbi:hypothetical protein Tco_0540757 [Tanacetum coccineum]